MKVNFCSPKTRMVSIDDRGKHLSVLFFWKWCDCEVRAHEFDKMLLLILHTEKDIQGWSILFQEPSHSSALFLITTPVLFLCSEFSFQLHISIQPFLFCWDSHNRCLWICWYNSFYCSSWRQQLLLITQQILSCLILS